MRAPIKLNASWWPKIVTRILRGATDPRVLVIQELDSIAFSRAVSVLKFGETFKSTGGGRFPLTLNAISAIHFEIPPIVLDIGASDGSTSLDVMRNVNFHHYYVTDLNLTVCYSAWGNWTYFYNTDGTPILAVSNHWIAYPDTRGANLFIRFVTKAIFKSADKFFAQSDRIELITPELKARLDRSTSICQYDALEPWAHENVDLVVSANILNRLYFDEQQLRKILGNIRSVLREEGRLVLIDNRATEQSSILKVSAHTVSVEARVGTGSDVEALAIGVLSGAY